MPRDERMSLAREVSARRAAIALGSRRRDRKDDDERELTAAEIRSLRPARGSGRGGSATGEEVSMETLRQVLRLSGGGGMMSVVGAVVGTVLAPVTAGSSLALYAGAGALAGKAVEDIFEGITIPSDFSRPEPAINITIPSAASVQQDSAYAVEARRKDNETIRALKDERRMAMGSNPEFQEPKPSGYDSRINFFNRDKFKFAQYMAQQAEIARRNAPRVKFANIFEDLENDDDEDNSMLVRAFKIRPIRRGYRQY
jgi:hypothetical protein